MPNTNTNNFLSAVPEPGPFESHEVTQRPEAIDRRHHIERFLSLAAGGDKRLLELVKNPETLNWLIAFVEKKDGRELYIPQELETLVNQKRLEALDIPTKVDDAKFKMNRGIDSLPQQVAEAHAALLTLIKKEKDNTGSTLDATLGKILQDLAVEPNLPGIRGRRIALLGAARDTMQAVGQKTKQTDLLATLNSDVYKLYLTDAHKAQLADILKDSTPVDIVVRDKVLGVLTSASTFNVFTDGTDIEATKKAIQERLNEIEVEKRFGNMVQFPERQDYNNRVGGSNQYTVLRFSIVDGKLSQNILDAQLKALEVNIPSKEIAAKLTELGVAPDGTLPADWETDSMEEMMRFLESNGMDNPTGISLSNIYDQVNPAAPKKEKIKQYVAALGRVSAEAGRVWWKWIASLPRNVVPQATDVELNALLQQENALNGALSQIDSIATTKKSTEDLTKSTFKDLQALQDDIDANSVKLQPAGSPAEEAKQAELLLKAGRTAMDTLNANNATDRDYRVREAAFYAAMTRGSDDARQLLNNPELYTFTNIDFVTNADAYHQRVNRTSEASGKDILEPLLNRLGLRVRKDALNTIKALYLPNGIDALITDRGMASQLLPMILEEEVPGGVNGGLNALITAYGANVDVGAVTASQASGLVGNIHQHLARQLEEYTIAGNLLAKPNQSFDVVGGVRTAMDTISSMINSPDNAERVLGWGLIFGASYGVWKAFNAEDKFWRNALLTTVTFGGLEVAVKKATGKGILDRLNMTFMNEKDRNSSLEQFFRKAGKEQGYEVVKTNAGREAGRQLMDPKNPIDVANLLAWRDAVQSNGRQDFSIGAPPINVGAISAELGASETRDKSTEQINQRSYEIAYLAFEALCINVADANGLGGANAAQRAALGAELIRKRYIERSDPAASYFGMNEAYQSAYGSMGSGGFSMLDVLIRERPTAAIRDALENATIPELIVAKLGVAKDKAIELFKDGASFAEIKARDLASKTPALLDKAKVIAGENFDSFMDWVRPTLYKGKREVVDDVRAIYDFIVGTGKAAGVYVVEKAPGVFDWVIDTSVKGVEIAKNTALATWREMHRHHITGPIAEGLEKAYKAVFGESLEAAETAEVADTDAFIKGLQDELTLATTTTPPKEKLEEWLSAVAGVPNITEFKNKTKLSDAQRVLAQELLKREVFSRLVAQRIADINKNKKIGRIGITWKLQAFDTEKKKFTISDAALQNDYDHIRSNYNLLKLLPLIGNEETFQGMLTRYAASGDELLNKAAAVASYVTDIAFKNTAHEYLQYDLKLYVEPLLTKAATDFGKLSPDFAPLEVKAKALKKLAEEKAGSDDYLKAAEKARKEGIDTDTYEVSEKKLIELGKLQTGYKNYSDYIDSLVMNVILESALDNKDADDFRDTKLTAARAKTFLQDLKRRRGKSPEEVLELFKNKELPAVLDPVTGKTAPAAGKNTATDFSVNNVPVSSVSNLKEVEADKDAENLLKSGTKETTPTPAGTKKPTPDSKAGGASAPPEKDEVIETGAIDSLIKDFKAATDKEKILEHATDLLAALSNKSVDAAKRADIRKAFDETMANVNRFSDSLDMLHAYLQGAGKPDNVEIANKKILDKVGGSTDAMKELSKFRERPNDPEQARLQLIIDRAIYKRMTEGGDKSIIARIAKNDLALEIDLLEMYKATRASKDDLLSDAVSFALEWVKYKGKNEDADAAGNTYLKKYEAYLAANGVKVPATPKGAVPRDAKDRMNTKSGKVKLTSPVISKALADKLKSLPEAIKKK